MILKDNLRVVIDDYVTCKDIKVRFFRYKEGAFRKAIFAVNRTLEANQEKGAWAVTEVHSTAICGYGNTPEEAMANTAKRLKASGMTYRDLRRLARAFLDNWYSHQQKDELPFLQADKQLKLIQDSADGIPYVWNLKGKFKLEKLKKEEGSRGES